MKDDHPFPGRVFMTLNFSNEQMDEIQSTILECMEGKPCEFPVEDAIVQIVRERNEMKAKFLPAPLAVLAQANAEAASQQAGVV
jgi:hypothetical protein